MVLTRERIMRGRASDRADCTGAGRSGLGTLLTGRREAGSDAEAGGTELVRSDGLACAAGVGARCDAGMGMMKAGFFLARTVPGLS